MSIERPSGAENAEFDVTDQLDAHRLDAIREARAECRHAGKEAELRHHFGELTRNQAALYYRRAVESWAREVRQYADVSEVARAFWTGEAGAHIGEIVIQPPAPGGDEWETDDGLAPSDLDTSGLQPVQVDTLLGLTDLLEAPELYTYTYETSYNRRHGPDGTVSATVRQPIPKGVLDNARDFLAAFCRCVGLDLSVSEDNRDAGYDYSDLLNGDGE